MASRINRSVPVTVNDVLDGHVKLDLQCLDRLYLHGYLGRLQVSGQLVQFLKHRGYPIPSAACWPSRSSTPRSTTGSSRRYSPPGSPSHRRNSAPPSTQSNTTSTNASPPPGCLGQPEKLRSTVKPLPTKGRYAPSGTSPGRSGP